MNNNKTNTLTVVLFGITMGLSLCVLMSTFNVAFASQEHPSYLGRNFTDISDEDHVLYNFPDGVYVQSVENGSPLSDGDIVAGDIIYAIDGAVIDSRADLSKILSTYDEGDVFTVEYYRNIEGIYEEDSSEITVLPGYEVDETETEEETENTGGRPYLGIKISDISPSSIEDFNMPIGVYVHSVKNNSPADDAGILTGDIITSVNGVITASKDELADIISSLHSGDKVKIIYYRLEKGNYKPHSVKVKLGVADDGDDAFDGLFDEKEDEADFPDNLYKDDFQKSYDDLKKQFNDLYEESLKNGNDDDSDLFEKATRLFNEWEQYISAMNSSMETDANS